MTVEFPCTHPDSWACTDSRINPGSCGTQEIHDAAMGCIDGHYTFNPTGTGDVGSIDTSDGHRLRTGWTGVGEPVLGEMTDEELNAWDELDQAGNYAMPPERGDSFGDERDGDA